MLNTLYSCLNNGAVYFSYTKKDGSRRRAFGTLNHDLITMFIGEKNTANSNKSKCNHDGYVVYFDLEKMAFRQFKKDGGFVSVECVVYDEPYAIICQILANYFNSSNKLHCDIQEIHDLFMTMNDGKFSYIVEEIFSNYCGKKPLHVRYDNTDNKNDEHDLYLVLYNMVQKECEKHNIPSEKLDSNGKWCMQHNGGRGLNGVMLSAGGVVSSGFDCFGNPISHMKKGVQPKQSVEPTKQKRTMREICGEIAETHIKLSQLYKELASLD